MMEEVLKKTSTRSFFVLLVIFLASFFFFNATKPAEAASLTVTFLRLDRMIAGGTPSGTACAKIPSLTPTEGRVVLAFPSTFTLSTTPGDWTINTAPNSGWPSVGTTAPWPGMGTTAMSISGTAVILASGDITGTTAPWYCFNFTGAGSSNGTAGVDKVGTITTQTSGASNIDSGNYATAIISDDRIVVSAIVPPTFSMVLGGGNTAPFTANLSASSIVSTNGNSVTIATNATNGWMSWVKSNAALTSLSSGGSIATPGTVNDDPEDLDLVTGYVMDADITTQGGGSGT